MSEIRRDHVDRLLTACVLLWTFLLSCTPMKNFDIWWHVRTGQLMLERGAIPWVDWYTFTEPQAPWIDQHWGFQLLVAGLFAMGGVPLLILAKAAVTTVAVGLAWSAAGRNLPVWLKALCWAAAVICITGRSLERPETLSLAFLAAWFWVLSRVPHRPALIWTLLALQVCWVNFHVLFVLGLIVGAAWLADHLVRTSLAPRWGLRPASGSPSPRTLLYVGGLMPVACLLNPYFEAGALFPLEVYRKFSVDQEFYAPRIDEFTPPLDFFQEAGLRSVPFDAGLILWLATLVSFVWMLRRGRLDVFRLLLFVAFSHLGWEALRNWNLSALSFGFLLSANLNDLFPNDVERTAVQRDRRLSVVGIIAIAILTATHFTGHWGMLTGEQSRFGLNEAEGWYAHGAARFAAEKKLPPRAIVVPLGQAAPYIYHNAPQSRVFMDGRLEVCSRQTFERLNAIQILMARSDPRWQSLPGVRDANGQLPVVILDSRQARPEINGLAQTPGWRLVFADAAAAVFIDDALAHHLGLPMADPTPLMFPPGTQPPAAE